MSGGFRYQSSVAVFGNRGGKVLVVDEVLLFKEQKFYPTN